MALTALKKLARRMPEPADIKAFSKEVRQEKNDRGAAMLICSFLDQCLKVAILRALPNEAAALKLFEDRGVLYDFSAKISMAQALGLYGDVTRRNLDVLRNVRNIFAHSIVALNFQTPEVAQACDLLTLPERETPLLKRTLRFETAREKYVATGFALSQRLFLNSLGTLHAGERWEIRPVPLP